MGALSLRTALGESAKTPEFDAKNETVKSPPPTIAEEALKPVGGVHGASVLARSQRLHVLADFMPTHLGAAITRGRRGRVAGGSCTPSPSHVPHKSRRPSSRRLRAGRRLASNTGNRQVYPGSGTKTPGFDADLILQRFNRDTRRLPDALERLLGPRLMRSSRTFPLTLTTTVFSQRSTGCLTPAPGRPTPESQQSSISRTAPLLKLSPT
jgi:hypothetical protein